MPKRIPTPLLRTLADGLCWFMRRSDPTLAKAYGLIERLMERQGLPEEDRLPLAELKEMALTRPQDMRIIRNLVLDARPEQVHAFLGGLFTHYIFAHGYPKPQPPADKTHVRIGLAGGGPERERLRAAYAPGRCEDYGPARAECTLGMRVSGLEIHDPSPEGLRLANKALTDSLPVSLAYAALPSGAALDELDAVSRRTATPLRIFSPLLTYPPLQVVKALIAAGEIGELCGVRIRGTIGGRGGALPPVFPDPTRPLDHPALDLFPLLIHLGGPVAEVAAYLNPFDPAHGGQALVSAKFARAGLYGHLELAWAPQMQIPSTDYPYDLECEIAGSDGIIWLNRGMAKRTNRPPIVVRVADRAYSIGVESGLAEDWSAAYGCAADDFCRILAGQARPDNEVFRQALRLKERAYAAALSQEHLRV